MIKFVYFSVKTADCDATANSHNEPGDAVADGERDQSDGRPNDEARSNANQAGPSQHQLGAARRQLCHECYPQQSGGDENHRWTIFRGEYEFDDLKLSFMVLLFHEFDCISHIQLL